jgi:hypothetical protein
MKQTAEESLALRIASAGEGLAAFFLTASLTLSILVLALGGTGAWEPVPISILSALLLIGISLKFRMWIPAVVGGFVGFLTSVVFLPYLVYVLGNGVP